MPYLIDSDWMIDHLANVPEANRLLEQLAEEGIAISVVTYMEAYQGISRSPTPEQAEALFNRFVEGIPVIPFSIAVARRCAGVREALRKQNRRVNSRALDLIIAATALEYELTLVSRNLDDYSDIPDLKVYRSNS
jgi:tRNA(fMet)-specific endonuclease VapC